MCHLHNATQSKLLFAQPAIMIVSTYGPYQEHTNNFTQLPHEHTCSRAVYLLALHLLTQAPTVQIVCLNRTYYKAMQNSDLSHLMSWT